MGPDKRLRILAVSSELLMNTDQVLARPIDPIFSARIKGNVAISGTRSGNGRPDLHDHIPSDVRETGGVGEFNMMDAAINPIDDEINPLIHSVAGETLGEDAARNFFADLYDMADVLGNPAFLLEAVG
jgi:hypothetical protein